jgi:hypothetical protein
MSAGDNLADDMERLVEIAKRVLAGEPIENFDLGEYEIFVVIGYTQKAMGLSTPASQS